MHGEGGASWIVGIAGCCPASDLGSSGYALASWSCVARADRHGRFFWPKTDCCLWSLCFCAWCCVVSGKEPRKPIEVLAVRR